YYNTDFDYTRAQRVQSIGTSAYVTRRSTWEGAGMFDERFGQYMVDLAYNFRLNQLGYEVWYMPGARVIHYGSRSISQNPAAAFREETSAFILFNESYGYFSQNWLSKKLVRAALKIRLFVRLLDLRLRGTKTVVKGQAGATIANREPPRLTGIGEQR
ncbi:MAG TPA: hypothetical protein VE779_13330, partial [Candidatus Angelobacter sp.]|nr:hypothetical protein [Candidatus Angelobacter sp.]